MIWLENILFEEVSEMTRMGHFNQSFDQKYSILTLRNSQMDYAEFLQILKRELVENTDLSHFLEITPNCHE